MRLSKYFIPTLREAPAEAEIKSHILMLRAGMIRKVAAGIYTYLPLGLRVIKKVENVIRNSMNEADAIELSMPSVQPAELWQESGRWSFYGKELLRFKDRHNREFCYGPTHEEVITDIVRSYIKSYRHMPLNLYQIQTKFRDEVRPRFGLMRGREFIMKDAYSFDVDDAAANISYEKMRAAYCKIFERCGLDYRMVDADSGSIGGSFSHEFMVLASSGEDAVISCAGCNYAANLERASVTGTISPSQDTQQKMEIKDTPKMHTVEEVATFLTIPIAKVVKTIIVKVDDKSFAAILVRGDHEANLIKLKNHLNVATVEMAAPNEIFAATGSPVGFCGPVGLSMPVYVDYAVANSSNVTVGANVKDKHIINCNIDVDYNVTAIGDFRNAVPGDICPKCGKGQYTVARGIEVGHIFKLGTKYSAAMNAKYADAKGAENLIIMGCYGIGVGRTAAAAIEQNHDESGIMLPFQIAPFEVVVVPVNMNDPEVLELSEKLYKELLAAGVDVAIDDRDERAGVKFNDADLIGYPLRVSIGKKSLADGNVEIIQRRGKISQNIPKDGAVRKLLELLNR